MAKSWSVGWLAWDGKKGQLSWKRANRKKGLFEAEGRTKTQREKARKARQKRSEELGKARTKAAEEKAQAKKKARYEKDKARASREQAFRARAEGQAHDYKVTQTAAGTWGHSGTVKPEPHVVRGEVLAARDLTAIESAGLCGAPNKTGGRCMRSVAPGSRCPVHRTGSKPATSSRSGAGAR
jgi:hypothetical protein